MVKIVEYNLRTSNEGNPFYALTVQGGIEVVKTPNGGSYLTARKCSIPTTFNEATCQMLIGQDMPGTVKRVECEPYDYTVPQTGEVIILTHKYEYVEEQATSAAEFTNIVTHSSNGVHQMQ